MSENVKKEEGNSGDKKEYWFLALIILTIIVFVWFYHIIFYEFSEIRKEINNVYKYSNILILEWTNDTKIFSNRLSNLESKYIDVISSKETINFWLSLLLFFIPVLLWYTVFQRNKMLKEAESDLNKINKLKESAESKIKEAEEKATITFEKIDERINKKLKEFEKNYKNKLKSIESKVDSEIDLIDEEWEKQRLLTKWIEYWKKIETIDKSIEEFNKILNIDNKYWLAYYNLWCAYSIKNDIIKSIDYLNKTIDTKLFEDIYYRYWVYKNDEDFNNIRNKKEFKNFIKKLKEKYWDK